MARSSDLLLAALLVLGAVGASRWISTEAFGEGGIGSVPEKVRKGAGLYGAALALLILYGLWAGATTLWSFYPDYALAKSAGSVALALGAGCVAWSGVKWDRALDAWLLGTGLTLAVAFVGALAGPDVWVERMVYGGGSVSGLPLPRLRGPFLHPNGFGDYLVISAVFLWARWPVWTAANREGAGGSAGWRSKGAAWAGAAALTLALLLTVSTAWLAAGILLLLWGRRLEPGQGDGRVAVRAWLRSLGLRAAGAGLTAVTMAGLVFPLRIGVGDLRVVSSGIRPRIWSDAAGAFLTRPFVGVGATPYLAGVADPLDPSAAPTLWDAHNVYLSVLGQFGLIGFLGIGVACWLVVRVLRRPGGADGSPDLAVVRAEAGGGWPPPPVLRDRARTAVLAVLLAMAVHGVAIAGEDFRHWWAVLGVAGVVALARRGS